MIEFIKGRSVTFTLVFNAEYDPDNIEDIIVKIGSEHVWCGVFGRTYWKCNIRLFDTCVNNND